MIRLGDIAVSVRDAKASAKWWVEKMGFRSHTIEGAGEHPVLVAPPGDRYILHLCEGFEPVDPGNTGIGFMSDDIENDVARMKEAGVVFAKPFEKQEHGGTALFQDPDGNTFWLIGMPRQMVEGMTDMVAPDSIG